MNKNIIDFKFKKIAYICIMISHQLEKRIFVMQYDFNIDGFFFVLAWICYYTVLF